MREGEGGRDERVREGGEKEGEEGGRERGGRVREGEGGREVWWERLTPYCCIIPRMDWESVLICCRTSPTLSFTAVNCEWSVCRATRALSAPLMGEIHVYVTQCHKSVQYTVVHVHVHVRTCRWTYIYMYYGNGISAKAAESQHVGYYY